MWQTFFTRKALKGKLTTPRALEGGLGTRAVKALGHLRNPALEVLGNSKDTWALGHSRHFVTWALRHLDT